MIETFLILNGIILAYVAYMIAPIAAAKARENARAKLVEMVIGMGPTMIAEKSTMVFSMQPRTDFTGTRLVVPASIANHYMINDIRADGKSVFELPHAIPAAAFSEQAVGVNLDMPEVAAGKMILISVSNVTDSAQPFSAALIGLTPRAQRDALPSTPAPTSEPATA
jgi:hypothetical protein